MAKHKNLVVHSNAIRKYWKDDNVEPAIIGDGIYRVSWPDHVSVAWFNGDCDIVGPFDSIHDACFFRDGPCEVHPDI